jgi:hypothetical protein
MPAARRSTVGKIYVCITYCIIRKMPTFLKQSDTYFTQNGIYFTQKCPPILRKMITYLTQDTQMPTTYLM